MRFDQEFSDIAATLIGTFDANDGVGSYELVLERPLIQASTIWEKWWFGIVSTYTSHRLLGFVSATS